MSIFRYSAPVFLTFYLALLPIDASAQTTWTVREYGSATPCGCFSTNSTARTIVITSNPGRTLKFEVFFSNSQGQIYYGPAPLQNITIAPGVTGTINIESARNPSGPFNGPGENGGSGTIISTNGASILARANLRFGNGTTDLCILKKLKVGVLGNPDDPDHEVLLDLWDGQLAIGSSALGEPAHPHLGDLLNRVEVRGVLTSGIETLTIRRDLIGELDFVGNPNRRIDIGRDLLGKLHIHGDLPGATGDPDFTFHTRVTGNVAGELLIDGGLHNGYGDEVLVLGSVLAGGAIVVDYDGYESADDWQPGATVRVSTLPPYTSSPGNYPGARIYRITACRGDMNNDGVVNSQDGSKTDPASSYRVARDNPTQYAAQFPGLDGSRTYHGNCNRDFDLALTPPDDKFDTADDDPFERLKTLPCCVADCDDDGCPTDLDKDGDTDIGDMAILLSNFGLPSDQRAFPCSDIDGNGAVGIEDLAVLLSNFGLPCGTCSRFAPPDEGGESAAAVSIAEEEPLTPFIETTCSSGNGYAEVEISLTIPDAGDAWTVSGMKALAMNGAAFVCEATATVSASALFAPADTSLIIGGFDPPSQVYVWSSQELNASWIGLSAQNVESSDLVRVTIAVGDVELPFVWEPPTAYFSGSGPVGANDVAIASVRFVAATRELQGKFVEKVGEIYVAAP